jgi:zinc transporter, ZIP family
VKRFVLGLLALGLIIVAGALVVGFAHPWRAAGSGGEHEEMTVERATVHPGRIMLTVRGEATEPVRLAQVIVDDAFADFETPSAAVRRHRTALVTILYPWLRGETYEIDLLTSTGAMVEYELEDAGAA